MIHFKLEQKIKGTRESFQKHRLLKSTLTLIPGILAFVWFLIRVIPKPLRATYPCMKVAYPLMSGLVIWLLGVTGISASVKLFFKNIRNKKYLLAFGSVLLLATFSIFYLLNNPESLFATEGPTVPVHIPNAPFGVPQGIIPGRVVWSWDPDATNENCTNDLSKNDGYFLAKNNNQEVIDNMLAGSILALADKKSQKEAWDAIFRHFNKQKGRGDNGYKNTETIFIKINQGCANWTSNSDFSRRKGSLGYSETSPEIIISALKQLVNVAGVPQNKIIVADPLSHIYSDNFEQLHSEFPDVIYGDRTREAEALGRTFLVPETTPVIFYSDKGTVLKGGPDCLYSYMQNADYLINIAALKAHAIAGITLLAKNHFGSNTRKTANHLHAGLIGERNDQPYRLDYGMYRVQVDLMGSKYLGRNTMINIVDGLWGGPEATKAPVKWQMEPFNNDWPNSVFVSLDQVALESVCFDFLRSESTVGLPDWRNRPNFAQGVDDYLHQAASSKNWPEGIIYDPDNSGTPIPSLGVHEHWNNPVEKKYSRNLGKADGIELVKILAKKRS
jgi:hypothetical protein